MNPNDQPAFPAQFFDERATGMTLRQYAAIKLRVPDSGNDWLDEMIRHSLRDEFAANAMQAMLAHPDSKETASPQTYASAAYTMADAMLEAGK